MRDEVVHPFKPSTQGNGSLIVLGTQISLAITVPHAASPEYPGVARILSVATGLAFVRTSNATASPTPAANTDVPIPPNVVCYIELDQDTKFLTFFGAGSGSLFVNIGTGGLSS